MIQIQTIISSLTSSKGVTDTYIQQVENNPIVDQLNSPMIYGAITVALVLRILLVVLVVFGILYACQLIRCRRTGG